MPRATVNYALAATLLSQGLNYEQAATQTGAKNGNSLKVGLSRRGVTLTATRSGEFAIQRATMVARTVVNEASKALKESMSGVLDKHTSALAQVPVKANLKHIQRVGAALEPLARTAKLVHGWGDEQTMGIVALGVVEQLDQAQDVIDISSSVPETPSNGVPETP